MFLIPIGKQFDVRNPLTSIQHIYDFYKWFIFPKHPLSARIFTLWSTKYVWIYDELIEIAKQLEKLEFEKERTGNKTATNTTSSLRLIKI